MLFSLGVIPVSPRLPYKDRTWETMNKIIPLNLSLDWKQLKFIPEADYYERNSTLNLVCPAPGISRNIFEYYTLTSMGIYIALICPTSFTLFSQ